MTDIERKDVQNISCSDCGYTGNCSKYDGSPVPEGGSAYFCITCLVQRKAAESAGNPPKPIGYKMTGVYTKKVYEGARSIAGGTVVDNFVPEGGFIFSHASDEGSWWIREACVVRGSAGLYLVFHGYQSSIYTRYFAVWIEGPYEKTDGMDLVKLVERVGVKSRSLFTEVDKRITVELGHPFGRRFRGLLESETISGSREDQVFAAVAKIIS